MHTIITAEGSDLLINGKKTYSELDSCKSEYHGLLMNVRFIQALFDEKNDPSRYNRFTRIFDPDKNTDNLIQELQNWYDVGVRAITVGMQGGGPCNTINNFTNEVNPYSKDGTSIDSNTLKRLVNLVEAADKIGMVIILSYFYGSMTRFLEDDEAVVNAVKTTSNFIRDKKYTNIIIEIANEHNINDFAIHPILKNEKGIVTLMEIARRESGNMMVGCSGTGGYFSELITKNSDCILMHSNNLTKTEFYNMILKCKEVAPNRPIVFNEDSAASSRLEVAFDQHVSWGYYNNMSKQEPPTNWSIMKGEDEVFAAKLSKYLGINSKIVAPEYHIMGLSKEEETEGKRWIRLSTMKPEYVSKVDFYHNNKLLGTSYDEPFMLNSRNTWKQDCNVGINTGDEIRAVITNIMGEKIVLKTIAE
jgi:hypothetical protein